MAKKQEPERDFHVPLDETLKWIDKGEKLLMQWQKRPGVASGEMVNSLWKHLEKLKDEAERLEKLSREEKKRKAAR